MPELPEVETVVRDLRPLLIGRTLQGVRRSPHALRQPWSPAWEPLLTGQIVAAVHRRGKWILVELGGGAFLMVHLGMTGQFTVRAAGVPGETHTHLVFPLDNSAELRFRDIRRFGSVTYFADRPTWESYLSGKLGPEPWDMDPKAWRALLKSTKRNLKAILLDQTLIAGVGNIYVDESCHAAKLDPRRTGESLTAAEANRLLTKIRQVLTSAIDSRGSTIRDYVGGSGLQGGFQREFRAYGRTGEPCPTCGVPIERVRVAGRSSHFCPQCQRVAAG